MVGSRGLRGEIEIPPARFLLPAFSFGEAKENAEGQLQISNTGSYIVMCIIDHKNSTDSPKDFQLSPLPAATPQALRASSPCAQGETLLDFMSTICADVDVVPARLRCGDLGLYDGHVFGYFLRDFPVAAQKYQAELLRVVEQQEVAGHIRAAICSVRLDPACVKAVERPFFHDRRVV